MTVLEGSLLLGCAISASFLAFSLLIFSRISSSLFPVIFGAIGGDEAVAPAISEVGDTDECSGVPVHVLSFSPSSNGLS